MKNIKLLINMLGTLSCCTSTRLSATEYWSANLKYQSSYLPPEPLLPPVSDQLTAPCMGVARIFQRGGGGGGHTESCRGYSPDCHLNIVGCLLTKRLTKGGSHAPRTPLAMPLPWLAQLVEEQAALWEVEGLSPRLVQHLRFKITEENVLSL